MRWSSATPPLAAAATLALVAAAFAGCKGVSEFDFIADYEARYCERYVLCATDEMLRTVNHRECLEYYRYQEYPQPPECPFDRKAAETCLDNLSASGCEGNDPELPASCLAVFSDCQFPLLPREDGDTLVE
jgi:hypothetical protein